MKKYIIILILILIIIIAIYNSYNKIEYFDNNDEDICISNNKSYYLDINNYILSDSCKKKIFEVDDTLWENKNKLLIKYNNDSQLVYKLSKDIDDNIYYIKTNVIENNKITLIYNYIANKLYIKQKKKDLYYLKFINEKNVVIKENNNDEILASLKFKNNKYIFTVNNNKVTNMLEIFILSYILILKINIKLSLSLDD